MKILNRFVMQNSNTKFQLNSLKMQKLYSKEAQGAELVRRGGGGGGRTMSTLI